MRNNQMLSKTEHSNSQVGQGDIQEEDAIHTKTENCHGRTEYLVRRVFPACWEAHQISQRNVLK
jgi:hypothetical protein